MKLKLWLRNLSVSSPHVQVRTQLPWALRLALLLAVVAIAIGGLAAVYKYARNLAAPDRGELVGQLEGARAQLDRAIGERDRFAAEAAQAENQLKVERATREQISLQVKTLEADNARLRGDLAFFESLLPAQTNARGVVIRSFRMQPEADDSTMRYRLLIQQSGRPDRDFVGAIGLKVNLQKDGNSTVLELPDAAQPAAGPAPLAFRHYQRIEGSFAVPAGATVRSVQVTISSGGETKAQQTFSM